MARKVNELLDDLRRGEFHIDCLRMELVRASDGKCFEGPGYIRQKPTRDFEIKLYSEAKIEFREVFDEWASGKKAGVLYGEQDHFVLTATDESHRRWAAARIINPGTSGHAGRKGCVVSSDCQEVAMVEERWSEEKGNWVRLEAFERFKFPRTTATEETVTVGDSRRSTTSRRNAAQIVSNGLNVSFEEGDGVSVYASTKDEKPHPQLELRMTEAVAFALGFLPSWSLVARSEGRERVTRFRSPEKTARKTQQWPPYKIELIDDTGSIWRMFDLFLTYVLKDTASQTHGLSRDVIGVAQTRGSSAEGQALAASVAVESIVSHFYPHVAAPDDTMRAAVDGLIKHIRTWTGDSKLVARAIGAIGGMKRTRPDDSLRALVEMGVVGEGEREAWKKLRNTAAHGSWHRYENNLQELLDLTGKVHGLLNQLVFHLIGYAGKQTDYGTHDWPTVDYPPKTAEAETVVSTETKGEP